MENSAFKYALYSLSEKFAIVSYARIVAANTHNVQSRINEENNQLRNGSDELKVVCVLFN